MYIDDCLEGTGLIMESDFTEPLNLGSDRLVTINQLVDVVESIAGVKLRRRYNPEVPKGVRGRNSDNTLIQSTLGWAPGISLEDGLEKTYQPESARISQMEFEFAGPRQRFCYKNQCNTITKSVRGRFTRRVTPKRCHCGSISTVV
jgi:hypothetical protein